jgi:hypothetical protein
MLTKAKVPLNTVTICEFLWVLSMDSATVPAPFIADPRKINYPGFDLLKSLKTKSNFVAHVSTIYPGNPNQYESKPATHPCRSRAC